MPGATPDEVRRTLVSVITRPELKDTFLSKPPFRFIHDVFSNVTACTGFGKGLFADLERDDRENLWTSGKSDLWQRRRWQVSAPGHLLEPNYPLCRDWE